MAAGADIASFSMHKSGGSLTQSSLLLTGPNVHAGYVQQDLQPDPDDVRQLPAHVEP